MYKFVKIDDKFDIRKNFWSDNYQFRYIEPFKQLYDLDESVDKVDSSKTMWGIWLYSDPSYQNKIGKLREDEKKSAILSYCPHFDFKDDLINKCIIQYDDQCLSEAARAFKRTLSSIDKFQVLLEKKLEEEDLSLDEFIQVGPNRWVNKKGNAVQILDLKKKLSQIWKDYENVKRLFEEEQGNIQLYGGGKPTVIEEGGLEMIHD
ncbi:MAG TPA: hypothetical protein PLG47_02955 [Candidatus Dojkabacteria bacterium]|nr:hypothetical protein [Candidatus Dojkabacteria bacterium]